MSKFLTVEDVAANLLLSVEGVRRLIKRDEMEAVLVGRKYLIEESDFNDYLELQRMKGKEKAQAKELKKHIAELSEPNINHCIYTMSPESYELLKAEEKAKKAARYEG